MDCSEIPSLDMNRFLLIIVGLWPYTKSRLVRFQVIVFFIILISYMVAKFTAIITSECTSSFVINFISVITFYAIFVIKYCHFFIRAKSIKRLLDQIRYIYSEIKDKREFIILEKYGNTGRRATIMIMFSFVFVGSILLYYVLSPRILDVILPVNETRRHSTIFKPTEYFIDEEKYFLLIGLHGMITLGIGGLIVIATGTMLNTYLLHICGMFKIASYRIEQAIMISVLRKNSLKNVELTHKGIIYAVDMHRKAMKNIEHLLSITVVPYSVLIMFSTISTSLNLYKVSFCFSDWTFFGTSNITFYTIMFYIKTFHIRNSGTSIGRDEIYFSCIILLTCYIYAFICNHTSQEIIDQNNNIFLTAYNAQWYKTPLPIQKQILFLLQRGTKIFNMNIGGLFVASLEGFATLISYSISYFTVIYSINQE